MNALSAIKPVLLLALTAALAACAGLPQPYSQLYGSRYFKAPIDTYPVQIVRIDGHDTVSSPVFIEPGVRQQAIPRHGEENPGLPKLENQQHAPHRHDRTECHDES